MVATKLYNLMDLMDALTKFKASHPLNDFYITDEELSNLLEDEVSTTTVDECKEYCGTA